MEGIAIVPRLFLEFCGISIILSLIYFNLNQGNSLTDFLPTISLFAMSGFRLMPSANRLISSFQKIKFSKRHIGLLEEGIRSFEKKENKPVIDKDIQFDFNTKITIKDLTFKYEGSKIDVLKKL